MPDIGALHRRWLPRRLPGGVFEIGENEAALGAVGGEKQFTQFRRVRDGRVQIEENVSIAGWNDHTQYEQRIRNYTAKPIEVEVRRAFDGHVVFRSDLAPTLHDYRTVQYTTQVPAATTARLPYEVLVHQGHNAQQNNVTLEKADAGAR